MRGHAEMCHAWHKSLGGFDAQLQQIARQNGKSGEGNRSGVIRHNQNSKRKQSSNVYGCGVRVTVVHQLPRQNKLNNSQQGQMPASQAAAACQHRL